MPNIKTLKVTIPIGFYSKTRLRVPREGGASKSDGKPGDLYIYFTVLLTEGRFRREGITIFSELMITAEQASQGGKIDVVTIHGERKLTLPKQVSNGRYLMLKGHGVRNPPERGDHVFQVRFS